MKCLDQRVAVPPIAAKINVLSALAWLLLASAVAFDAGAVDVRVLIDVSGSMQKNDPNNLRRPAVRLISELLPDGSSAGVWLFSEDVVELVPFGAVDADWKARSREALQGIHSRGLFTDIEAVLREALRDWQPSSALDAGRHVILLTDGMVDIAKEERLSIDSRDRILGELVPQVNAVGAQIHTVALSSSSDAALLEALAKSTDGWAKTVENAEQLQRVFLHMFEQATSPDSIPLDDNRFAVDPSIEELTLLIFRQADAAPTTLTTPSAEVHSKKTRADNINWIAESTYDLITIKAPEVGNWRINADFDPDNRALIVTDVKLELAKIASNLMVGEQLALSARITERDEAVRRQDFLDLIKMSATSTAADTSDPRDIELPLQPTTGEFESTEQLQWPIGEYEIVVSADGGTFKRQQRRRFKIHESAVAFEHELATDPAGTETVTFSAKIIPDLVEPDELLPLVSVVAESGLTEVHEFGRFEQGTARISIPLPNGQSTVQAMAFGTMANGRPIGVREPPITFGRPLEAAEKPTVVAPAKPQRRIDLVDTLLVVVAGNVAILLLLGGVWGLVRWRGAKTAAEVALT